MPKKRAYILTRTQNLLKGRKAYLEGSSPRKPRKYAEDPEEDQENVPPKISPVIANDVSKVSKDKGRVINSKNRRPGEVCLGCQSLARSCPHMSEFQHSGRMEEPAGAPESSFLVFPWRNTVDEYDDQGGRLWPHEASAFRVQLQTGGLQTLAERSQ